MHATATAGEIVLNGVQIVDIERLVSNVGVPATFMMAVAYVIMRYGPRVIEAHLEFIEAAKWQGERCVEVQERQEKTLDAVFELVAEKMDPRGDSKYRDHVFSTARTNEALCRFTDVVAELTCKSPQGPLVAVHLNAIRQLLGGQHQCPNEPATVPRANPSPRKVK